MVECMSEYRIRSDECEVGKGLGSERFGVYSVDENFFFFNDTATTEIYTE